MSEEKTMQAGGFQAAVGEAPPPTLSIVVPVWDRADTIRRCFDSIFGQAFQDYEVVAVDDASTDDSLAVMRQYTDSRLHIIQHSENRGYYGARRTGIKHARADWVLVVGSDDALLPGALDTLARMIHTASPAAGLLGMSYRYEDGSVTPGAAFPSGEIRFEAWLEYRETHDAIDILSCYRRSLFEEIGGPDDGRGAQQFMIRLAARYTIWVDPNAGGVVYSDAPNRLSAHKVRLLSPQAKLAHAIMFEEIIEEFGAVIRRRAPKRYKTLFFAAGLSYFLVGRRLKGARYLCRFLAMSPFSLVGWAHLVLGLLGPNVLVWARSRNK